MNVVNALSKFQIDPSKGVNKAVFEVSKLVNESNNRLSKANRIIEELGGPRLEHERYAVLMSQAMVEYAVEHIDNYNANEAFQASEKRYQDLKEKMPWACMEPEAVRQASPTSYKRKTDIVKESPKNNNKKKQAIVIFNNNKDKPNGEIAKLIAAELEITYANAYYYVSRVFKR